MSVNGRQIQSLNLHVRFRETSAAALVVLVGETASCLFMDLVEKAKGQCQSSTLRLCAGMGVSRDSVGRVIQNTDVKG